MSSQSTDHNQYTHNGPIPVYVDVQTNHYNQHMVTNPQSNSTGYNFEYQHRAQYHNSNNPKKVGWLVYFCGGFCGFTLLMIILIGILIHVPWLGIFGFVSIAPGLLILWRLYWKKHKEHADLNRVVKFITFGMLGVIPVAIIEMIITFVFELLAGEAHLYSFKLGSVFLGSFVNAFLVAALCEETFKYMVAANATAQTGRDTPYSILIFSMSAAVGLATFENMMYILMVAREGNLYLTIFTAITRALMAVPLHTTTGILIGADVAERKFGVHNKNMFKILLIPFGLHGVYDFCTMFASSFVVAYKGEYYIMFLPFISFVTVIVGVIYARKRRNQILNMGANPYQPLSITV